jgi:hypothetical protein
MPKMILVEQQGLANTKTWHLLFARGASARAAHAQAHSPHARRELISLEDSRDMAASDRIQT